ncbi:nose resistant to fluoxetine protein 6-like [Dermatophagoides pteronyssinus]|uniref:nose resistant to fluoxetine protein 6-like n=1 Tax=Dermatophagoides pteronyssinus TaxID=6956 RepID=UPI003F671FC5
MMAGSYHRRLPLFVALVVVVVRIVDSNDDSWNRFSKISNHDFQRIFLPNYLDDLMIFKNNNSDLIDQKCRQDLQSILNEMIYKHKLWATKIFNSWSPTLVSSGFLSGTITDYGDYDQCLHINDINYRHPIQTEYCLLEFEWPISSKRPFNHNVYHQTIIMSSNDNDDDETIYTQLARESSIFYYSSIVRGICLPNSCTKNINFLLQKEIFGFKLQRISCYHKPEWPLKPNIIQSIAIFTIGLIISITFVAGLYDYLVKDKNGHSIERILLCFSPMANFRSLIRMKSINQTTTIINADGNDLSFIDGLRFWSNVWIIIAHTFVYEDWNSYKNIFEANEKLKSPIIQSLMQFINPVDVFIFIGGFMASYTTLKNHIRNNDDGNGQKKFNPIIYIGFRYLRFTPQLIIYILLSFLLPLMGFWLNGPLWSKRIEQIEMKCSKTWLYSLIYAQNLIEPENMCGGHTWYLAVDMQLRLLSIIPLWFFVTGKNSSKQGLTITKILVLISIVITSLHIFIKKLPPGLILTSLRFQFESNRQ